MEWSKLSERFGSWASRIKPFYDKGGFDSIYKTLIEKSRSGIQIAPAGINTYRAFKETDYNNLKAVIICQDPYFKFIDDQPIATGVAMDCSLSARAQPTLKQFYNGIERELYDGLELNFEQRFSLDYLSKQGVLLLNVALTVEKDKPGSHTDIWEDFTVFLLKEVIGPTGVPVLFLGKNAGEYEPVLTLTNPTHTVSHPASAAYAGQIWNPDGAFVWLNEHIWLSNNETIMWLPLELPF